MNLFNATILSLGLVLSGNVSAEKYFDGTQVLKMCNANFSEMSAGCSMFILGSAEAFRMAGFSGQKYCLPDSINNQQLKKEYVDYLTQHPQSLNYSATSLFFASLMQNHSCKKKS